MAEEANNNQVVNVKPTSNISFQCPILGETNYPIWSLKIKAIFKAHDMWDAIDPGVNVEPKKDNAAIAYLYQALPEDLILQVASCETAKAIWDSIKTRHLGVERVMEARLQSLKTEFDLIRMKEGEKVDDFVAKLTGISSKSATLGSPIEESALVRKLLTSVPDSFLNMVATIEQLVDLKSVKFQEVVGRLKAYEERTGARSTTNNHDQLLLSYEEWESKKKQERCTSRGRGSNFRGRGQAQGRSSDNERGGREPLNDNRDPKQEDNNQMRDRRSIRCYNCGKIGHHGDDCRTIRCYKCDKLGHHGDDCRTIRCHNCDKLGHYATECWNKRKPNETKEEMHLMEEYEPALLMTQCVEIVLLNEKTVSPKSYAKEGGESVWYLDNGASNHMTGNRKYFNDLDETTVGKVRFGDNSMIDIKGKGSVLVQCKNGEQRLITNVYYTPHLSNNILSLGQFTEEGCKVMMEDDLLKVYEKAGKLLLKVARTRNRLYKIKLQTVSSKYLSNKLEEKITTEEVDNPNLVPTAPKEPNMSHIIGQNVGQKTADSSNKNQQKTATVSLSKEAEKQPVTPLVFGSFNMKKDETKKGKAIKVEEELKGVESTTADTKVKLKEVHKRFTAEKKRLTKKKGRKRAFKAKKK